MFTQDRGGAIHASLAMVEEGGRRNLQKPYQTALGILARPNVPGGTVADELSDTAK